MRNISLIVFLLIILVGCNLLDSPGSNTPISPVNTDLPASPTPSQDSNVNVDSPPTTASPLTMEPTSVGPEIPTTTIGLVLTATPTPNLEWIYTLQAGTPAWLPVFAHPEAGCNIMVVAGQVFGLNNRPEQLLVVEVSGTLEGKEVGLLSLTGVSPVYGPGGYEIILSDHPTNSNNTLNIQIKDLSGQALTKLLYFNTYADCSRNLVLINFLDARSRSEYFLPLLMNKQP